jgi:hypothetical protein
MRWLKHLISISLLLAAGVLVVAIGFSDHSDDYGRISLPQGGTVHLPKGDVTIYDRARGEGDQVESNAGHLSFGVTPVDGSGPLSIASARDELPNTAVTRTETVGEFGAIAKLDVPSEGDYVVRGSAGPPPATFYLEFGTNAGRALLDRWKLIAGLLLGALLVALIPVPRSRRHWEGEPSGWSSDPRAPYAGGVPEPAARRGEAHAAHATASPAPPERSWEPTR